MGVLDIDISKHRRQERLNGNNAGAANTGQPATEPNAGNAPTG